MSTDLAVHPARDQTARGTGTSRSTGVASRHLRLVLVTRAALLALCVILQSLTADGREHRVQLLCLLAVALFFTLADRTVPTAGAQLAVVEAMAVAAVIGSVAPLQSALLPYLLAPALAAGLRGGTVYAVAGSALTSVVLIGSWFVVPSAESAVDFVSGVAVWIALSFATALLGAWVRRIELTAEDGNRTYAKVHQLLLELRDAARHLPGSLDEVTIAQSLLQDLRETTRFDRAGIVAVNDGDRLVPLARLGSSAADMSVELTPGSAWHRAWKLHLPATAPTTLGGERHAHCLVLPVTMGETLVALVGLERPDATFTTDEVNRCAAAAKDAAAGLDTASLFAEVRTIAAAEERRRLAREIHDGIAQELASLGYVIDDLISRSGEENIDADELRTLRRELTRVVTELRLSIFDLRSEVRADTGVGEALGAYVRSVGAGSGLTVHLVLDESSGRLRVESEAELLRIAQEAITNARKHAGAENLWVTCRIDPPHALLRIEDDGAGLGSGRRAGSYGMDIMNERASRIGGVVHVGERPGGGTLVEVIVGNPRRGTGTAARNEQPPRSIHPHDDLEGVARVHRASR